MEFSQHPGLMEAFREGFQTFRGDIETHLIQILEGYIPEDLPTINAASVTERNMKKSNLPIGNAEKLSRYFVGIINLDPFCLWHTNKLSAVEILSKIWSIPIRSVGS